MVHAAGEVKVPLNDIRAQMDQIANTSPLFTVILSSPEDVDECEAKGFHLVSPFMLRCLLNPATTIQDWLDVIRTSRGWVITRVLSPLYSPMYRVISRTDEDAEKILSAVTLEDMNLWSWDHLGCFMEGRW